MIAQLVKNPPARQEILVQFLARKDPLEKGEATHSSVLAWRIPWTVTKSWTSLSDSHFQFSAMGYYKVSNVVGCVVGPWLSISVY